jgi:short-subunit dehydrogenase involved in D-alanine esterification of teichoic acids
MPESAHRVLVTGGSARIGLAIVRAVRAQGIDAIAAAEMMIFGPKAASPPKNTLGSVD